jgi:hypothetical protein
MSNDPVKTIKEYKRKGYHVSLYVDSSRPTYAIEMTNQGDVKRFTVPIDQVSYKTLHDIVRGA